MTRFFFAKLLCVAPILFCVSCASHTTFPASGVAVPMKMFGKERAGSENFDLFPQYRLASGDVLDAVYKFQVEPVAQFKLMPLDVIEVKFPSAPEMNEAQSIRLDGVISLPYVGEIQAAGRSPREIETELRGKFASILRDPDLYVVVRDFGVQTRELKDAIRSTTNGQSKLLVVRTDGFITFPLIGDVLVAGKTVPEVGEIVNAAYVKTGQDVRVDILLQRAAGVEISVLGAVNRPGFYPINRPVSILEALALAGGLRDDAKPVSILSIHKENGRAICNRIDTSDLFAANPEALCVMVGMNDTIFVSRSEMSKMAQFMSYVSNILMFRGFGVNYTIPDRVQ